MDSANIFAWDSYRQFLEDALQSGRFGSRGPRTKLAEAAGCQIAYVSQVLKDQATFSLEQANGIANYLKLGDDERSYFFDLVLYARAANEDLRSFYRKRLHETKAVHRELSKRLGGSSKIADEYRATYYSVWYNAAIHMLAHIPKYRTVETIAARLRLDYSTVQKSLQYLVSIKLLRQQGQSHIPILSDFHLSKGSPFLSKHLYNWRIRAMLAADEQRHSGLHYSSVMSLNSQDADAIREILTRSIEKSRQITSASKDEESVFVGNIDFFEL